MGRVHWGFNEQEPTDPYWGAWTSTLNWCEQDYAVSRFIAEFVNTLTNAWVLVLLISMFAVHQYRLPKRFYVILLGISCVGIGSWMFHMTLRWEWQVLGDEIPMIIAACCLLFMVLETTPDTEPRSIQRRNITIMGSICIGLVLFVSVVYIYTGIAAFHQVSFAIIEVVAQGRVFWLLRNVVRANDKDAVLRRKRSQIVKTFLTGAVVFLVGFLCWNADNLLCSSLSEMKKKIGAPYSFLFELHGWWHLLTGYGTVLMSHAAMYLVMIIREGHENFEMDMWGGWMPVVRRTKAKEFVALHLLEDQDMDER